MACQDAKSQLVCLKQYHQPLTRRTPLALLRVPRSSIARARVGREATELFLKVLQRDLSGEDGLVVAARDGDLLDSDLVKPRLDEGPDGGEAPRGVDLQCNESASPFARGRERVNEDSRTMKNRPMVSGSEREEGRERCQSTVNAYVELGTRNATHSSSDRWSRPLQRSS